MRSHPIERPKAAWSGHGGTRREERRGSARCLGRESQRAGDGEVCQQRKGEGFTPRHLRGPGASSYATGSVRRASGEPACARRGERALRGPLQRSPCGCFCGVLERLPCGAPSDGRATQRDFVFGASLHASRSAGRASGEPACARTDERVHVAQVGHDDARCRVSHIANHSVGVWAFERRPELLWPKGASTNVPRSLCRGGPFAARRRCTASSTRAGQLSCEPKVWSKGGGGRRAEHGRRELQAREHCVDRSAPACTTRARGCNTASSAR